MIVKRKGIVIKKKYNKDNPQEVKSAPEPAREPAPEPASEPASEPAPQDYLTYKQNDVNDNLVFIYTFDTYSGHMNDHLVMLIYSILSVHREFPEKEIRVYTSTKDSLEKYLDKFPICIMNCPAEYLMGNDPLFPRIGHARFFIIRDILFMEGKNVIYMDNDTKVNPHKRWDIVKFLSDHGYPVGYCPEGYMSTHDWCWKMNIDPYKIYMRHGLNINNGLLWFPHNNCSKEMINHIVVTYHEILSSFGYSYGLDQIAMNKIFYENRLDKAFIAYIPGHPLEHYYCSKDYHLNKYIKHRVHQILSRRNDSNFLELVREVIR